MFPPKIKEKSINHYLNTIKKHPDLQDKIEFKVIETCYALNSKKRLLQFLSKKETNIYLNELREIQIILLKKIQ